MRRHVIPGCLLLLVSLPAQAGHLAGAEIDLHHISGDTYRVILNIWSDCASPFTSTGPVSYESPCGSGSLTLSPLDMTEVSMVCAWDLPNTTCNGGVLPGIELVRSTALVELPPCDSWVISTAPLCCPVAWSGNFGFALPTCTTTLNNALMPCRDTPRYERRELPNVPTDSPLAYDLLPVVDGPGDFTSELTALLDTLGQPFPYVPPFSGTEPFPGVLLHPDLAWLEAPPSGVVNGYTMNVQGTLTDSLGQVLGTVQRFFMLGAWPGAGQAPSLASGVPQVVSGPATVMGPRSMSTWPGAQFCFQAEYTDPDSLDLVTLESDIAQQLPGATVTLTNGNPATLQACWSPAPGTQGLFRFRVDALDGQCPIEGQQAYGYAIRVLPDTLDPCLNVGVQEAFRPPASLTVVPNPARDVFTIDAGPAAAEVEEVRGHDLRGREVPLHWTASPDGPLRVQLLSDHTGLLVVQVRTARSVQVARVVLQP